MVSNNTKNYQVAEIFINYFASENITLSCKNISILLFSFQKRHDDSGLIKRLYQQSEYCNKPGTVKQNFKQSSSGNEPTIQDISWIIVSLSRHNISNTIDSNLVYSKFVELLENSKGVSFGPEIGQIGKILSFFEQNNIKISDEVQVAFKDKFFITNLSKISDSLFIILLKHLHVLPLLNESLSVWQFIMEHVSSRLSKMNIESFANFLSSLSKNYFLTNDMNCKKILEDLRLDRCIVKYIADPKLSKFITSIFSSFSTLQCVPLELLVKICLQCKDAEEIPQKWFMIYKSIVANRLEAADLTGKIKEMKVYVINKVLSSFKDFRKSKLRKDKIMDLEINILLTMCNDMYYSNKTEYIEFITGLFEDVKMEKMNSIDIFQMYSILVAFKTEAPYLFSAISPEFIKFVVAHKKEAFDATVNKKLSYIESFSKDVYKVVKEQFSNYTIVEELYNGLQSNDIYIKELNLVIEVDGYSHYYSNSNHELQNSVFKYRMFDKAEIIDRNNRKQKLLNYIRICPTDFKDEQELRALLDKILQKYKNVNKELYLDSPNHAFDKFLLN